MTTLPKIVFPEGDDERIVAAVAVLREEGVCEPVVIGIDVPVDTASESPVWQGAAMVASGDADAIVSGAVYTTADVLRAYLKTIGTAEGIDRVSSCFLLERYGVQYMLADCAVNIDPSPDTLAETAHLTASLAPFFGITPRVAFLSFATGASAAHESITNVSEAVQICRNQYPELLVEGPIQADAALVPAVAEQKLPEGALAGDANVLIFPDLNSGNIAYKLLERLGGFSAVGPLLLGFAKPAHDLSRGCSVEDIVAVATIAAGQCHN